MPESRASRSKPNRTRSIRSRANRSGDGVGCDVRRTREDRRSRPTRAGPRDRRSIANGGISSDGVMITYHLHHGVRWQDGRLTAADVAFTYRTLHQSGINSPYTGFYRDYVRSVVTPDPFAGDRAAREAVRACGRPTVRRDDRRSHRPEHLLARRTSIAINSMRTRSAGPFELRDGITAPISCSRRIRYLLGRAALARTRHRRRAQPEHRYVDAESHGLTSLTSFRRIRHGAQNSGS